MPDVIVLGAGVTGLSAALLLAFDGHEVEVLEKDPGLPAAPSMPGSNGSGRAWRSSVFRAPCSAGGKEPAATRVAGVLSELERAGAATHSPVAGAWAIPAVGGRLPGDERFDLLGACRPVLETALAAVAARTRGITVSRGVTVSGLVTGDSRVPGRPHVNGVVTAGGRSSAPIWWWTPAAATHDWAGCSPTSARRPWTRNGRRPGSPPMDDTSKVRRPSRTCGRWTTTTACRPCSCQETTALGRWASWSRHETLTCARCENPNWQRAAALFPPITPWAAGTPLRA
ncbi:MULTISPECIES: FAD-dependent oxidoreductase [Nonomuraea]|uniref:FAD-dependent oxidoreductase n=1 Tax=Nonomuraea mangrovi TaxID=2316207 RepID=A0ABW4SUW3_9ACTN